MSDTAPFVEHVLPNGESVFYRDDNHSYWSDVKPKGAGWAGVGRLTGVSTVVAPLDFRPDGLMRWAARLNGEGIAALASDALDRGDLDGLGWLTSGESIWQTLSDEGLLYDQARDRKATVGTNVHEDALQALAEGRPTPRLDGLTEEERGYAQAVIRFWMEHEPQPIQSEQVVADKELGIAGRFDLRASLHGDHLGTPLNGAICLLDAKTGTYRSNKEHAQLSGYDFLAEKCGIGASDRLFVLQVMPDGDYRLLEGQGTRDAFLNAVAVYRDAARIGNASRAQRKAVEEIAA